MGDLRTRALTREEAAAVWSRLDERGTAPLAVSWPWTDTWLEHYGDVVDAELVAVERGGEPVAVALLARTTVKRRGIPVREVHVGTAGEPQGETVFVERNALNTTIDRADTATALLGHLADQGGWDTLVLDGFVGEDFEAFAGVEPTEVADSPYTDLAAIRAGDADVVAALRKGPRQRVRRTLKQFGDLTLEWAETEHDKTDVLDELIDLHQQRWTAAGEPGAFASERFTRFHRALIARLGDKAILVRARTAQGSTIGCLLCYADGDRVLFYQSGFRQFDDPKLRPGLATHALAMQAALERGYAAYDFLAGEGRYKDELSTATDRLSWGAAPAKHLRGRLLALGRRLTSA